jgi:NTE family protein
MSFEFTQPQFDQICSDLSSVPLSFAVTASSAVPVLLSPMTLRNHAAECERPLPSPHLQVGPHGHQATLLLSQAQSYADATHRPYVHLVDGGLADNIGVRRTLDSLIAQGGLFRANAGPGPRHAVHRIFVIAVNSERDPAYRIDLSDRTPTTFQVLDALMFGSGSRSSRETLALLRHLGQQWQDELRSRLPHPDSPWADDLQLHVVTVNLRDVRDAGVRDSLLHEPTAFTIAEDDVTRLIAAGRKALRESAEFQAMVASLQDAREAM